MKKIDESAGRVRDLARAAKSKKGEDIVALDLRGLSNFTDFFVIVTGTSSRQNKALAYELKARAADLGFSFLGMEASEDSSWVLLDLGEAVVHVFMPEAREYYALEFLWEDAEKIRI